MMKLEKVTMKTRTLKTVPGRGNAGFTAIEIAMVAAVIAILSLIVLPIFRNRVEDAKLAAAQADLNALMKAQQIVKADTDAYARLEDLDNVELLGYTAAPAGGVNKEVPFFRYIKPRVNFSPDPLTRQEMNQLQREQFAGTETNPVWRGPYIAFQNSILYEDFRVLTSYNNLSRNGPNGANAAVQDYTGGNFGDHDQNRIPVDPWGNPYLFFAPTGNAADPSASNGAYPNAVIYSMGPNGLPGDGTAAGPAPYTHAYSIQNPNDDGALGKDDDLMVEF